MTTDTAHLLSLLRANVWKPCDNDKAWGLVDIRGTCPNEWLLRKWQGHLSQLKKLGLYEAPSPGGCFGKVKF